MKRLLSMLLVTLAIALTLAGCGSGSAKPNGTLVVGTPKLNGDFITGFGNSSYDNWVRKLTGVSYGYLTYDTTPGGEYVENAPVIKKVETSTDEAGNKTYAFEIQKDLKWSDGEKITARDYVLTLLLNL